MRARKADCCGGCTGSCARCPAPGAVVGHSPALSCRWVRRTRQRFRTSCSVRPWMRRHRLASYAMSSRPGPSIPKRWLTCVRRMSARHIGSSKRTPRTASTGWSGSSPTRRATTSWCCSARPTNNTMTTFPTRTPGPPGMRPPRLSPHHLSGHRPNPRRPSLWPVDSATQPPAPVCRGRNPRRRRRRPDPRLRPGSQRCRTCGQSPRTGRQPRRLVGPSRGNGPPSPGRGRSLSADTTGTEALSLPAARESQLPRRRCQTRSRSSPRRPITCNPVETRQARMAATGGLAASITCLDGCGRRPILRPCRRFWG